MSTNTRFISILTAVGMVVLGYASLAFAHNTCCTIVSKGVPAAAITLDGVIGVGEWAGAGGPIALTSSTALSGTVTLLHKADGLYVQAVIYDSTVNNNDAFNIRLDFDNNGGSAPDNHDLGVQILRSGQGTWGPADANPATWGSLPGGTLGVTANNLIGSCPDLTKKCWIVEYHLPTGAVPTTAGDTFAMTLQPIGVYFSFYDADDGFGLNSAKYAQWSPESVVVAPPPPPAIDANSLFIGIPDGWGNLSFDPQSTFPDVSVENARRNNGDPSKYNKIDYQGTNSFEVEMKNPGGTVIADATGVHVNLYLAARGIGLPWKRIDTNAELTTECAADPSAWPTSALLAKTDVCTGLAAGSTPLPDISTLTISQVVNNTKGFTIQNGLVMNRTGGLNITVPAASDTYYPVIDWNTTPLQDHFFVDTDVNGNACNPNVDPNCYALHHYCMWGEAIVPNDPNPGNNGVQVNMDFTGVPFTTFLKMHFLLGSSRFAKYDPNAGKSMFLNVTRQNMDDSFKFELLGLQSLPNGNYQVDLKGTLPLPLTAQISATDATALGTVVKQNLMVPAKAGAELEHGCHHRWWCPFYFLVELFERQDTEEPVHVKVQPGSTLWIANYALDDKDVQYVNVDGRGPLPHSGPEGLPPSITTASRGKLLVPGARVGELVLSFDNFKTGIGIGQGVQVRVPPGANDLALAINDNQEKSQHHEGTGFRLRITNKPTSVARAKPMLAAASTESVGSEEGRIQTVPIADVLPQVCVNGYEDTGHKEPIGQQQFEMYRSVGNVCWTVTAILQEGRPKPDKGDPAPR